MRRRSNKLNKETRRECEKDHGEHRQCTRYLALANMGRCSWQIHTRSRLKKDAWGYTVSSENLQVVTPPWNDGLMGKHSLSMKRTTSVTSYRYKFWFCHSGKFKQRNRVERRSEGNFLDLLSSKTSPTFMTMTFLKEGWKDGAMLASWASETEPSKK